MSEGGEADKFLKFPSTPSSARNRVATLTSARLLFGYFILAKQNKVKVTSRRATPGLVAKGTAVTLREAQAAAAAF
jgi:hypothetical protein